VLLVLFYIVLLVLFIIFIYYLLSTSFISNTYLLNSLVIKIVTTIRFWNISHSKFKHCYTNAQHLYQIHGSQSNRRLHLETATTLFYRLPWILTTVSHFTDRVRAYIQWFLLRFTSISILHLFTVYFRKKNSFDKWRIISNCWLRTLPRHGKRCSWKK